MNNEQYRRIMFENQRVFGTMRIMKFVLLRIIFI